MLKRDHIAGDDLLEYAEGRAEPTAAARIQSHLATGCERCAHELAAWHRSLNALQADRQPGPPEWVVRRAILLGDQLEAKPGLWERIAARLTFDSRLQPALAGARDVGGPSFQLVYEAESTDIDLLCEFGPAGWQLTGQALPIEPSAEIWKVTARGPAGERQAEADSLGIFRFESLLPGSYELTLRGREREIVVGDINLLA